MRGIEASRIIKSGFKVCALSTDVLPGWLPPYLVRFYADFGLEQAVGAIKARVQDQGGKHMPLTAMRKAEIFQADELFRRDKSRMNSKAGIQAIGESVSELFHHIEQKCVDINAKEFLKMQCEISLKEGSKYCAITNEQVGLAVNWNQPFVNDLSRSALVIREYGFGLILMSRLNRLMPYDQPRPISEAKLSKISAGFIAHTRIWMAVRCERIRVCFFRYAGGTDCDAIY